MTKFKVGDTVRIVELTSVEEKDGLCIGDVGKVIAAGERCGFPKNFYAVVFLKHYYDDNVAWNRLEDRPESFEVFGEQLELVREG